MDSKNIRYVKNQNGELVTNDDINRLLDAEEKAVVIRFGCTFCDYRYSENASMIDDIEPQQCPNCGLLRVVELDA